VKTYDAHEAAAARAAAAKRKNRLNEADELELAKKVKSKKAKQPQEEVVEEEEEGEDEEEDEESEGGSTASDDMSKEMDVDVVLAHKKKTWEEKEEMILAVDKNITEAELPPQKPKPQQSSISFERHETVIQPLLR
jgi:hypothetical protein